VPVDEERPVGELVNELIENGKAYARAEMGLVKAIASAKADALKVPAILFGAAFLLLLAAVTALAVMVGMALAKYIGPLGGGLAAFLIFAGLAGGLAWLGVRKLQEKL
jgi:hypothetical protein